MPSYTVHLPRGVEDDIALERAVFVADGFHFVAFIAPPIWLIWYRQWVGLFLYLCVHIQMWFVASTYLSDFTIAVAFGLMRLLFGFEASSLRRWRLEANGWRLVDAFAADDLVDAETRFYARYLAQNTEAEPAAPISQLATAPEPAAQTTKTPNSPARPAGLPPAVPSVIGYQ